MLLSVGSWQPQPNFLKCSIKTKIMLLMFLNFNAKCAIYYILLWTQCNQSCILKALTTLALGFVCENTLQNCSQKLQENLQPH